MNDKTDKMTGALSEDTGQPGNLPGLIRVFAVHLKVLVLTIEPGNEKMCLMSYANNKGADQGLHCLQCCLHSLDAKLYGKATLLKFYGDYSKCFGYPNF